MENKEKMGMSLTDDKLGTVSGGRRVRLVKKGGDEIKTFRVTRNAGAPIWDGAAAAPALADRTLSVRHGVFRQPV